jgi:site-specific recombinase XerD
MKILEIFENKLRYKNYSINTIKVYKQTLYQYLKETNCKDPYAITTKSIIDYLEHKKFTSVSQQNQFIGCLKLFSKYILNKKDIHLNKIERPRVNKKLPIVLSQNEVQKMFDVCENTKHKVILSLLYSTGIRVSELINLKWENLDRQRGIINIIGGKGNKDKQVMFSDELHPLLERYWNEYKPFPYILKGQFSEKYSDRSVGQVIKKLGEKAGINKRVYTHLMRHNCFTHLVENGIDINLIQKLAGHNNVKTTLLYTQISHNVISNIASPLKQINLK